LKNGLPDNFTTKAMIISVINACWNWGLKQGLITKAFKLEGDTKGEARNRALSDSELKTLFYAIKDNRFNLFVRFAHYTGARRGKYTLYQEKTYSPIICRIW
tara:strand:+ start:132 stop:437 length:306 start_codon:yes stop_codon:yes gene_type:complete